jgi:hypothetical protein
LIFILTIFQLSGLQILGVGGGGDFFFALIEGEKVSSLGKNILSFVKAHDKAEERTIEKSYFLNHGCADTLIVASGTVSRSYSSNYLRVLKEIL